METWRKDVETCRLGDMDTWTNGHMETWTHGHMDTWTHGHMDTWTRGDKALKYRRIQKLDEKTNGKHKTEAQAIFCYLFTV
jgi:hypothetical protein